MQIRISEMLDNASELIEENIEVRYTNDNDRIKRIVFSEIKYMRRKHRKTGRGRNKIMQPVTAQRIETVKDKEKDMGKKILKVMQWVLGIILELLQHCWSGTLSAKKQSSLRLKMHTERLWK